MFIGCREFALGRGAGHSRDCRDISQPLRRPVGRTPRDVPTAKSTWHMSVEKALTHKHYHRILVASMGRNKKHVRKALSGHGFPSWWVELWVRLASASLVLGLHGAEIFSGQAEWSRALFILCKGKARVRYHDFGLGIFYFLCLWSWHV